MRSIITAFWEIGKVALIAFVLVAGLRLFVFQPFLVKGASMEPNFHTWDYLIVDEISYRFQSPERGEVIVFKFPGDPSDRYIKRIIGLPGETIDISRGKVTISDENTSFTLDESSYLPDIEIRGSTHITLDEDEYFVMGDNRAKSSDSRTWGPLRTEFIIGRSLIRVFPISDFTKIDTPAY